MKTLLFALLLLAIPSAAIADNLPANYMIYHGKIINLDHLWGKGVIVVQPLVQPTSQIISQPIESREMRANNQRIEYENARSQILIERLRNSP